MSNRKRKRGRVKQKAKQKKSGLKNCDGQKASNVMQGEAMKAEMVVVMRTILNHTEEHHHNKYDIQSWQTLSLKCKGLKSRKREREGNRRQVRGEK